MPISKITVPRIEPRDRAMLASYARSFAAAALALFLAGNSNPRDLIAAGLAAVLPPALRYANPRDKAFGRGSRRAPRRSF